jgi:hypothetical protein
MIYSRISGVYASQRLALLYHGRSVPSDRAPFRHTTVMISGPTGFVTLSRIAGRLAVREMSGLPLGRQAVQIGAHGLQVCTVNPAPSSIMRLAPPMPVFQDG